MLINNEKNRNLTIDGLLAIAALFVLFHHVLGWTKGDWGSLGAVGVMLFLTIISNLLDSGDIFGFYGFAFPISSTDFI